MKTAAERVELYASIIQSHKRTVLEELERLEDYARSLAEAAAELSKDFKS